MNPEQLQKILAGVAKILGLPEDANRERMIAALDGILNLQSALAGTSSDTTAAEMKEDDKPSGETALERVVKLATEAAAVAPAASAVVAPAAPAEGAMASEALALLTSIAEASGLDLPALLALLRERADAFSAFVKAPASGSAASDAAMLSRVQDERIKALEATVVAKDAEIARRESAASENAIKLAELLAEDAIRCGLVLPAARDELVKMGSTDLPSLENAIAVIKKSGIAAVPMGKMVNSSPMSLANQSQPGHRLSAANLDALRVGLRAVHPKMPTEEFERLVTDKIQQIESGKSS